MSTAFRALPARSRGLRDALSGWSARVTSLLIVALIHTTTVIADLDEKWETPMWLRLFLTVLAGLLLGSISVAVTMSPSASIPRIRRLVVMVYLTWWSSLFVTLVTNTGIDTGPLDLVVPAIFFVGSSGILGPVVGPVVLVMMVTTVTILLYDRRGSQARATWVPSTRLRSRHVFCMMFSIGLLTLVRPVTDLLARQHVERASVDSSGVAQRLVGPQLPLFVWVVVTVASIAVLLGTFWLAIGARFVGSRRPTIPTLHLYASAISLAFIVRLFTLLTVAPTRTDGGDPLFYHSTANLLANGLGFPEPLNFIAHHRWMASALHGPLYPLVLSFGSRFGGTTFFDHKMFSLVIGTAVVAFVGLVAHHVARPEIRDRVAVVAMLLAAVYPNLWIIDGVLFPEGLMALCTTATVWAAFKWKSAPARRWVIAMGLLTGLAALTRGEGLLLSVLLIVPWVLLKRELPLRRRVAHISWAALACVTVIAPWAIRNERSFEVSVPLSTNGNELFVYANCEVVYSGEFLGFWSFPCQQDLRERGIDATGDEAEKALFWREVGFDYARENIGQLPKVIAARIGRQWELFRPIQNTQFAPIEGRDEQAARAGLLMYYGLAAFSVVGVRQLRRRRVGIIPFASLFISVTLTAAYAYGTTRFRVPAEPALCVLAAVGLFAVLGRIRDRFPSSDRHDDRHSDTITGVTFVTGHRLRPRQLFRRESRRAWLGVGAVVLSVVVALPGLFRSVGASMEEGFMLVFPERVLKGAVANVDFLHLYGPGSLHFLAGWFELFGASLTTERWFGLAQHLLAISALYALARPWGHRVAVVVGAASTLFILTPIGLQALAWSGGVGLALWSAVFFLRSMHRESAGLDARLARLTAGALAGLALTFRPDLVVALALVGGYSLWKRSRRDVALTLVGTALGALSFWVHLAQAGPRAVIDGVFFDPVVNLRSGRELPRPPSWSQLDGALQIISEKVAPSWPLPHLAESKQLFVWFFILPVSALLITGIGMLARRRVRLTDHAGRSRATVLVVVGLMSIGLLPQALQRPDSAHLLWVSGVPWPFVIPAVLEGLRWSRPRQHPTLRRTIAISTLAALVLVVAPSYTIRTYADLVRDSISSEEPRYEVSRRDRFFYLGDERPHLATKAVIADLDRLSRSGERLFVGPVDLRHTVYSDAFIYHLFPELLPATRFIEMDPGIANAADSPLADEVRSADWLILTRFWSGWIEPNDSVLFGPDEPNQVVEEGFCLRGSYQYDLVRLYQRCTTGDGIGPYDAPYRPEFDYAVEVRVPVPPRPDGSCTPTCDGTFDPEYAVLDTSIIEPDRGRETINPGVIDATRDPGGDETR